jgi:hypothetical protein
VEKPELAYIFVYEIQMSVVAGSRVEQARVQLFQTREVLPAGFKYKPAPIPVGINTYPDSRPSGLLPVSTRVICTRCNPYRQWLPRPVGSSSRHRRSVVSCCRAVTGSRRGAAPHAGEGGPPANQPEAGAASDPNTNTPFFSLQKLHRQKCV